MMTCALDSTGRLWQWESIPARRNLTLWDAAEANEYVAAEYDYDEIDKPREFIWFKSKELTVTDIEAGSKALIIKVKDSAENILFYAMPFRPIDIDVPDPNQEEEETKEENDEEEEKTRPEPYSGCEKALNMIGVQSSVMENEVGGGIIYKLGGEN